MTNKKLLTLILCTAVSFTMGCESDENNLIAQAESCINENAGNESGIASCASFLTGLNSPRAKTLKCSITLTSAGLSNTRIVNAIEKMDDEASASNEVTFMTLIALNNTDSADQIPTTCSGTDSSGMEFIANAARMGTKIAEIASVDLTTIDEDTTFNAVEIDNLIDSCTGDTDCETTLGESAVAMYDTFCAGADLAENEVCADVNSAIASSNDFQLIGNALIGLLDPTP